LLLFFSAQNNPAADADANLAQHPKSLGTAGVR